MDHYADEQRQPHPQDKANFLSKITFFFTFGIIRKGFKKPIGLDDLYEVLRKLRSKLLGDTLENEYEKLKKQDKISVYRLMWRCYGKTYLLIGMVQFFMRSLAVSATPWAISKLISFFAKNQSDLTKQDAYFYAGMVIALNIINCMYIHNYMLVITTFGIKIRTAFCSLIYRKSLRLSESELSKISLGKIVTLLTKDVRAFEMMILYGNDVWIGFAQAAIVCGAIYAKMGVAAFLGVGVFFVALPFQIIIGKKATTLRLDVAKKTDARVQATQEILSSIETVKIYTWEDYFIQKISDLRKVEVKIISKLYIRKVIILLLGILTSRIAFYLLIMSYIWLGNHITAELVYFITTSFQRLRHAMSILIPIGIGEAAEMHASAKRIEQVLKAKETKSVKPESSPNPKILSKHITLNINHSNLLEDASLELTQGLTLLTGSTGSGKTMFLNAILKEQPVQGYLFVKGRISYSSQEPWIFPSTIKQNIIFGQPFNATRYKKILESCDLYPDLNSWPSRDETVISDKGSNLSRGQKARINLARALYKDSDVYLFDDCLESLNEHVQNHILKSIIELSKSKLCVLVSHNPDFQQYADCVVRIMDKQFVVAQNPSSKLLEIKSITQELINNKLEEKDDHNEADLLLAKPKNIYREVKQEAKVAKATYHKYIKFGGGYIILCSIIALFISTQVTMIFTDKLISTWVNLEEKMSGFRTRNETNLTEFEDLNSDSQFMVSVFSTTVLATTALYGLTAYVHFNYFRKASKRVHATMLNNVFKTVMSFFHSNLLGNILNRFSKDLAACDEELPFITHEFLEVSLTLGGIVVLLASVNLLFLIPLGILVALLWSVRMYYLPTGRNLQRLEASTRSPIVGYLSSTLDGLATIRSHDNADLLLRNEFDRHQDLFTSANYTLRVCTRGFGFALEILCSIFIITIILQFLFFNVDSLVGDVGLALTQAFGLTGLCQFGIRLWADLENRMTSVERALEYTKLPEDSPHKNIPPKWPSKGQITFSKVTLTYNQLYTPTLKSISFSIEPGTKVGIIGRTGAGKTSIISALLALYEVEGSISIDNEPIATINKTHIRNNISVIPQNPTLFAGSLRTNIDPLGLHSDDEIWMVLQTVYLQKLFSSLDVNTDNFQNLLSTGQKQLICLARALIRKNPIVVFDEATTSVDAECYSIIEGTIERDFAGSTVLIVTHSMRLVQKCDKVIVLEDGQLVEFDDTKVLLSNDSSRFNEMLKV